MKYDRDAFDAWNFANRRARYVRRLTSQERWVLFPPRDPKSEPAEVTRLRHALNPDGVCLTCERRAA